jgi:hypothetical protein
VNKSLEFTSASLRKLNSGVRPSNSVQRSGDEIGIMGMIATRQNATQYLVAHPVFLLNVKHIQSGRTSPWSATLNQLAFVSIAHGSSWIAVLFLSLIVAPLCC